MSVFVTIILLLLANPAHADDFIQQRNQIIQQQQELEALREESNRQKEALEYQNLERGREIQRFKNEQNRLYKRQQQEADAQGIVDDWSANKSYTKALRESQKQEEYRRLKAKNDKAEDESELVLSNDYYAHNTQTLLGKGFTLSETQKLNNLHRNFVYRTGKLAVKGDANAQFRLYMIYHYGFSASPSSKQVKKLKKIARRGSVDLSWEKQKEALIEAITSLLAEKGTDSMYVALSEPELPIVARNSGLAVEWLIKAGEQEHSGALLVMEAVVKHRRSIEP